MAQSHIGNTLGQPYSCQPHSASKYQDIYADSGQGCYAGEANLPHVNDYLGKSRLIGDPACIVVSSPSEGFLHLLCYWSI